MRDWVDKLGLLIWGQHGPHNACQRLIFSNVLQGVIKVSLVQRCDFNGLKSNTFNSILMVEIENYKVELSESKAN